MEGNTHQGKLIQTLPFQEEILHAAESLPENCLSTVEAFDKETWRAELKSIHGKSKQQLNELKVYTVYYMKSLTL